MHLRTAIAVLLGLLFQWAQLAQSAVLTENCRDVSAAHCDCCTDLPSCPCAKDGNKGPERPPLPVLPESQKLPVANLADTRLVMEEAAFPQGPRALAARPLCRPVTGYAGVRLSVAFCSFVM
jgi:hypothetical protein